MLNLKVLNRKAGGLTCSWMLVKRIQGTDYNSNIDDVPTGLPPKMNDALGIICNDRKRESFKFATHKKKRVFKSSVVYCNWVT